MKKKKLSVKRKVNTKKKATGAKEKAKAQKKTIAKKTIAKKTIAKKKQRVNHSITFSIKNVRCFAEKQDLKIKALTFLTGENSTGKTTILGCFRGVSELMDKHLFFWNDTPDFNADPYQMGVFNDIVRKTNKPGEFDIGLSSEESKTQCFFSFRKKEKGEEPSVKSVIIKTEGKDKSSFNFDYANSIFKWSLNGKNGSILFKEIMSFPSDISYIPPSILLRAIKRKAKPTSNKKTSNSDISRLLEKLTQFNMTNQLFDFFKRPFINMAPIRAKPERTYNPMRESLNPEGKEIPMTLMLLNSNDNKSWEKLNKHLLAFGKASGLFSDIIVKKFEKSTSGPFQLQFKIRGAQSNIMDIGYGISQILPVLVHIFRAPEKFKFLLQQPEVHLHPKAQAELSSLLINSIKTRNHSFIVETHSDYMVDRARIEIRKGNISPDDVSLIYLESIEGGNGAVKAHNISFDKEGNILDEPPGYRDFFLKETNQFLGFKDKS